MKKQKYHSSRSPCPSRSSRRGHPASYPSRREGPTRPHYSAHGGREKIYIYGKHALTEALQHAPQTVRKVFLSPEVNDGELRTLLKNLNLTPGVLKNNEIGRVVGRDTAHQGVIAVTDPGLLMIDFKQFAVSLHPDERTMLVLLDELTDPHNVGAIIRSAAAFGAAGVLIPEHHQTPITGTVVKTSAGMAFCIPLVSIGNVNQAVDALKKIGFRTYGLVMGGAQNIADEQFDAPALFIVGNEGEGIRQKTIERCDVSLRIPMDARTESLNASVSAAVVLYQWSIRHPDMLDAGK
jgi:23S rRNA (guanosine2251-2'-O)-methyltransferase